MTMITNSVWAALFFGSLLVIGLALFVLIKKTSGFTFKHRDPLKIIKGVKRLVRVFGPVFFLILLLWVIYLLFSHQQKYILYFYAATAGILIFGGWFIIRDIIAGIVLRAEENIVIGDCIQFNAFSGRIQKLGLRCLELKKDEEAQVIIPYSTIAKTIVTRLTPSEMTDPYAFTLNVAKGSEPPVVKDKIRQSILRSIWISLKKEPQIQLLKEHEDAFTFQVTVYPIIPEYGLKIENALKKEFYEKPLGH